ncbi:hypothetical protein L6164_014612 [Bauhinia variegata]|uniref:Uncharacterized protein n=1 Tax=Bauhinia variegata TaxID=167791 RepID=A0ACB9NIF3_BAUVA|nr:hypothetical protein L6164_014612 [Bauhinia variegata]
MEWNEIQVCWSDSWRIRFHALSRRTILKSEVIPPHVWDQKQESVISDSKFAVNVKVIYPKEIHGHWIGLWGWYLGTHDKGYR